MVKIRTVETMFIRNWLYMNAPAPKRVLDVGCGPKFPDIHVSQKGYELWGIDVLPCSFNPFFKQEDVRHMSFPKNYFHVVYSLSSIEHVGIERYGDENDVKHGDREAILEISRVLKPDGYMLITLPAGTPQNCVGRHRIYDREKIDELFEGFPIKICEYWSRPNVNNHYRWQPTTLLELLKHTAKSECAWLGNVNVAAQNVKP